MIFSKRDLPKKTEDLSAWYNKVVLLAELADYGPARGTMIYRPYGYAIWELIQKEMNALIKERGVVNAYFPLFIPESLIHKESKHLEGFSPELAVVTIGGGEELQEKLVVRPTSETIMYEAYSRWIQSWRDLPLMINQWNSAVRWEKRPYLFLRTTEFLWQEGHTAHADHDEAWQTVLWAMAMYAKIYQDFFALPGYVGRKSDAEKFAGADITLSYESLMPGGKVLQGCTAHDLGQNFSKPFEIKFQNKEGQLEYVWQTSWGLSTRSIGGMIMVHGDDGGLRLPPRLAPIQVIILPVGGKDDSLTPSQKLLWILRESGIRAEIDSSENETLGSKINKWELKGVPIRIEIGPKEIDEEMFTAARRDTGAKQTIDLERAVDQVNKLLEEIQDNLYEEASRFLENNTKEVGSYDEFKNSLAGSRGLLLAFWCENKDCETKIKEETKATTRCLPMENKEGGGKCVYCGRSAKDRWLFGQAY